MKPNFDTAAFANLLLLAKGTRSQSAFADEIGISREHLSRLINQKSEFVPAPNTLRSIAASSEERVSYIQLLFVANYLRESDLTDLKGSNTASLDNIDKKPLTATLMTALSSTPYEWTLKNNLHFDLSIELKPNDNKWLFICSSNAETAKINCQLQYNYLQVLKTSANSLDKFSFVTASEKEYISFSKQSPVNLTANLSIILINPHKLEILKEIVLINSNSSIVPLPSFNL